MQDKEDFSLLKKKIIWVLSCYQGICMLLLGMQADIGEVMIQVHGRKFHLTSVLDYSLQNAL